MGLVSLIGFVRPLVRITGQPQPVHKKRRRGVLIRHPVIKMFQMQDSSDLKEAWNFGWFLRVLVCSPTSTIHPDPDFSLGQDFDNLRWNDDVGQDGFFIGAPPQDQNL